MNYNTAIFIPFHQLCHRSRHGRRGLQRVTASAAAAATGALSLVVGIGIVVVRARRCMGVMMLRVMMLRVMKHVTATITSAVAVNTVGYNNEIGRRPQQGNEQFWILRNDLLHFAVWCWPARTSASPCEGQCATLTYLQSWLLNWSRATSPRVARTRVDRSMSCEKRRPCWSCTSRPKRPRRGGRNRPDRRARYILDRR
jgi:hypothetical protein